MCVCVLVTQLCPTLCHPTECSSPGSSLHGILQQKYRRGLPFPSPGDLSYPGIEPRFPAFRTDSLPSEPPGSAISSPDHLRVASDPTTSKVLSSSGWRTLLGLLCRTLHWHSAGLKTLVRSASPSTLWPHCSHLLPHFGSILSPILAKPTSSAPHPVTFKAFLLPTPSFPPAHLSVPAHTCCPDWPPLAPDPWSSFSRAPSTCVFLIGSIYTVSLFHLCPHAHNIYLHPLFSL